MITSFVTITAITNQMIILWSDLENQCFEDIDCQLATNDSVCRQRANSLASDKDREKESSVCMCREGFEMTDEEVAHVRAKTHAELADRVQILAARGGKL